jgi:hypothetical protein
VVKEVWEHEAAHWYAGISFFNEARYDFSVVRDLNIYRYADGASFLTNDANL